MKVGISLEEAQEILKMYVGTADAEVVPIMNAHRRVLAEDVYSQMNQPPFDRSPLDGYALKAMDSKGASIEHPIRLKIIEEIFAGDSPEKEITDRTASRIMTGAPIPKGADCVIRQEETIENQGYVEIFAELTSGENYCHIGEDIEKGELLLKKDTILNYAAIGILASAGVKEVFVYKNPSVSVLSTGDELMNLEHELLPGKIYDSNLYTIGMRLKEYGINTTILGNTPDSIDELCETIKKAIETTDILITTGGVSVGKKDLIKDVMVKLGANILFWRVKMKPGSPVLCSVLNEKLIISLSGNPAAAIMTFELLARTALAKYAHRKDLDLLKSEAVLTNSFPKESKGRRMLRGKLSFKESNQYVELANKHSSGVLSSILDCNCLVDVPAGTPSLKKGQKVEILSLAVKN